MISSLVPGAEISKSYNKFFFSCRPKISSFVRFLGLHLGQFEAISNQPLCEEIGGSCCVFSAFVCAYESTRDLPIRVSEIASFPGIGPPGTFTLEKQKSSWDQTTSDTFHGLLRAIWAEGCAWYLGWECGRCHSRKHFPPLYQLFFAENGMVKPFAGITGPWSVSVTTTASLSFRCFVVPAAATFLRLVGNYLTNPMFLHD